MSYIENPKTKAVVSSVLFHRKAGVPSNGEDEMKQQDRKSMLKLLAAALIMSAICWAMAARGEEPQSPPVCAEWVGVLEAHCHVSIEEMKALCPAGIPLTACAQLSVDLCDLSIATARRFAADDCPSTRPNDVVPVILFGLSSECSILSIIYTTDSVDGKLAGKGGGEASFSDDRFFEACGGVVRAVATHYVDAQEAI